MTVTNVVSPSGISRDKLLGVAYDTYYHVYVEELAADRLVRFWSTLDDVTKVLVALTASGSAVAGWALWNQPGGRWAWAVVAGTGALLSIVHAALAVPERIKSWAETKQTFLGLRIDLQTLRQRMTMNPQFDALKFAQAYETYRVRYNNGLQHRRNDVRRTDRFEKRVAADVEDRMAQERDLDGSPADPRLPPAPRPRLP